jgi:hypothetical protein
MAASVVAAGGEVGGMAARVPRQGPIAISCLISFLPRALRESPPRGVFAKQIRQATGAAGGFICIFASTVGWEMDGQVSFCAFVHGVALVHWIRSLFWVCILNESSQSTAPPPPPQGSGESDLRVVTGEGGEALVHRQRHVSPPPHLHYGLPASHHHHISSSTSMATVISSLRCPSLALLNRTRRRHGSLFSSQSQLWAVPV